MTPSVPRLRRIAGGLFVGVVVAVVGGCSVGGDDTVADTEDPAGGTVIQSGEFNDADVAFVQRMIPHHEAASLMVAVALDRASDPRVRDLAERIKVGHGPQAALMAGWLQDWRGPAQVRDAGGSPHGPDHVLDASKGLDAAGGLEQMPTSGPEFDLLWLQWMIEHHDGAVIAAHIEIDDGANEEAVALARLIAGRQLDEIQEIQQLLNEWSG